MNGRASKAIRGLVPFVQESKRELYRAWNRLPRDVRSIAKLKHDVAHLTELRRKAVEEAASEAEG